MKLAGKIAMVTGAGAGLGREIALTFAREGARLALNDIRREPVEEVAQAIRAAGGEARSFVADVSDSVEVRAMFEELVGDWGGLDVLVNNAGIVILSEVVRENILTAQAELLNSGRSETAIAAVSSMSDSQWRRTLSVHLDGTFYCLREALKVMQPRHSGKIINMASVAGLTGLASSPDYSAAKAGIIGLTKAVAREVIAQGIYVNAIAPGFIDTALLDVLDDPMRQAILFNTPIGRFGTTQEIAALALYLASDDSTFMVGQVLSPNGGYYI
jgi:3-oxoacyl-[acyl-carrier protein] reductase